MEKLRHRVKKPAYSHTGSLPLKPVLLVLLPKSGEKAFRQI